MHYIRHLRQPLLRAHDWRPPGPVEVNDDHWLRPKIVSLFAPENGREAADLVNPGLVLLSTAGSVKDGAMGRGPTFANNGAGFKATNGYFAGGMPADINASMVALVELEATTANRMIFNGAAAATGNNNFWGLSTHGSAASRLRYNARMVTAGTAIDVQPGSGTDFVVGVPVLFGASSFTDADHRLYVAGLERATSTTSLGSSRSTAPNVGTGDVRGTSNTNNAAGIRHLLLATYPAMTSAEHLRLYEEGAFGLILSRVERAYFVYSPAGGAPALSGSFEDRLAARPIASGGRGAAGTIAEQIAARPVANGNKAAAGTAADAQRLAPIAAGGRAAAGIFADQVTARPIGAGAKAGSGAAADRLWLAAVLSGAAGSGEARFGSFTDSLAGRPGAGGAKAAAGSAAERLVAKPATTGARGAAGSIADILVSRPVSQGSRQASGVAHLVLRLVERFSAALPVEIHERVDVMAEFGEAPIAALWEPYTAVEGFAA